MFFAEQDGPLPEPPTIDEVAAAFPSPLVTIAPQRAVRETGVNTISTSDGGGPMRLEAAAISYAVLRNPDDLDDPMNHVVLPAELRSAIADPSSRLSAAAVEWMRWARFPSAYEAVQTQTLEPAWPSLPERLALHMRNVIANTFREQRDPDVHDPEGFIDPPDPRDALAASIVVDGAERPGITIADEHVLAVGVALEDVIALVVWPKHLLPLVRLALVRRPRP